MPLAASPPLPYLHSPACLLPRPHLALSCSCPSGYETKRASAADTCTACQRGFFAAAPNTVTCSACPAGRYADVVGLKSCKICAAGFVSTTDSGLPASGASALGNAAITASTKCTACPYRTFRPSILSANTCTTCPTGRETKLASGASACTACIPGTVLLFNSTQSRLNTNCTACPAGTFTSAPGASLACTPCAAGSAVSDTGNQVGGWVDGWIIVGVALEGWTPGLVVFSTSSSPRSPAHLTHC